MADTDTPHPLVMRTLYVKDISFENPNAPEVFVAMSETPPQVGINVDVTARHMTERSFEVVLRMQVSATVGDKNAFMVELDFAGIATLDASVPRAEIEPLLLIEGPRQIFPFARATLANLTRDGGFPALVINPLDFTQFYKKSKVGTLTLPEDLGGKGEGANGANGEDPAAATA